MTPAAVVGLVVATAAAAAVLGARVERWRTRRALDGGVQIIDRFAQENPARAVRRDAGGPWSGQWSGQWVATPSAWATFQEGPEKAGGN